MISRADYDYWIASSGAGAGPFTVRLTDMAGHQITVHGIRLDPGVGGRRPRQPLARAAPPHTKARRGRFSDGSSCVAGHSPGVHDTIARPAQPLRHLELSRAGWLALSRETHAGRCRRGSGIASSGAPGAFVTAMLYDTVRPALLATLEPDQFQSTHQLNVAFLRPVRPGRVIGKGRIVHRDEDLVFLEASLLDAGGAVIATATATARVISLNRAPAAA